MKTRKSKKTLEQRVATLEASLPVITSISKLSLKKGDVLVLNTPDVLTEQHQQQITDTIGMGIGQPQLRILFISRGASVGVMRTAGSLP